MSKVWLNRSDMSTWAIKYCKNVCDDPKIRKFIVDPWDAFLYLKYIKYDEEFDELAKSGGLDYEKNIYGM